MEFVQNELGDDENAVKEAGFSYVGDAAVDDDAGVEDLMVVADIGFGAEDTAEGPEVQQFTFGRAGDGSDIEKEQEADDLGEVQRRRRFRTEAAQHDAHESGANKADADAGGDSDEALETHPGDAGFQDDGDEPDRDTNQGGGPPGLPRWTKIYRSRAKKQNEYAANKDKVQQVGMSLRDETKLYHSEKA
jgi:hypothetical protein